MRRRASCLLAVLLAAGCTAGQPYPPSGGAAMPPAATPGQKVAILLPLSGSNAALGQAMLRAARLALASPGSPELDARDTLGTPEGAAEAARLSLASGDSLILGPLTNTETAAVAPVAAAAGVAVLAFTSDATQARPGVWPLGVTAEQQVGRLVAAAREEGRSRFAAVLPKGPFGSALGEALTRDVADTGTPAQIRQASGLSATKSALGQVGSHAAPAVPAGTGGADAPADAPPPTPPAVDALLLGSGGPALRDLGPVLMSDGLAAPAVRVLGPALWARDVAQLGGLAGAWYVAPDPALRARFVAAYAAAGSPGEPPALADLAYDAAAVARVLAAQGYGPVALQRPEGFAGTDGVFALLPGGAVRRDLAVFQIDAGGGSHLVSPPGRSPGT